MKLKIIYPVFLVAILLSAACSEESSPVVDAASFTKIYDNNQFDSAFYPIDIKETDDNGFIVLARKKLDGEFAGTYLLRVDKFGNFTSENSLGETFVNPVGGLFRKGTSFYFFCMDATSKGGQLVNVDQQGTTIGTASVPITYPCAASAIQNGFVILGYDNVDKKTVIATIDEAGSIGSSQQFTVGIGGEQQIEEAVINSFFQYGRKLPYLVGQIPGGSFYFNGFYNYTFSLVFTDLASSDPDGLIQGQHDDGGFSAALPLGGNNFALSVFNFGENYILPNQTLSISASSPGVAVDLGGYILPELTANAPIRILETTIAGKDVIIFSGDTKAKAIGLWFYNKTDKKLLGSKYLGFSNPFEIGNVIQSADEGLALCGTTYVAGRFPRITIFKLSKDEVAALAN